MLQVILTAKIPTDRKPAKSIKGASFEPYVHLVQYFISFMGHILYYYTSEEFFLYKSTVDKWTIQHFTLEMNY